MGKRKNGRKFRSTRNNGNGNNGGNGNGGRYIVVSPDGTCVSVTKRMDALPFFGR